MTRNDAEMIAHIITKTLVALQGRPEAQLGVRATAIMLADAMEKHGRITADAFITMCAFDDPGTAYLYREGTGEHAV